MYQLDENYLDQKYFLRPIDNNQQWDQSENKLQLILRQAADRCYEKKLFNKDERDKFHISGKFRMSSSIVSNELDFSYCTRDLSCISK